MPGTAVIAVAVSHEGPPPSIVDVQYQAKTQPVFVPPITSVDRWFQPFAEPVRPRAMPAALQEKLFYTTVVLPAPSIGYFEPFSEPVRARPLLVAAQREFFFGSYAPTAPPPIAGAVPIGWEGPPATYQRIQYQIKADFIPVAVIAPPISYLPWSEPVRQRFGLGTQYHPPFFWGTEFPITPLLAFYSPFTDPVRARITPALGASGLFQTPFVPTVAVPQISYTPWSDPVRPRTIFIGHIALAMPVFVPPAVLPINGAVPIGWESAPPSYLRFQYQVQAFVSVVVPPPPAPQISYAPWSEPVRIRTGGAIDTPVSIAPFQPPAAPSFDWLQPLQGPRPSGFMSIDITSEFIAIEKVTEDRWHQPWSEPVRSKQLSAALQQALTWPVFVPFPPEIITEDKWHQPWSTPVRVTPSLLTDLHQAAFFNPLPLPTVTPPLAFYAPFTDPIRTKPSLLAGLHQDLAFNPLPLPPVPIAGAVPIGWEGPPASYLRFQYQAQAFTIFIPPIPVPPLAFFSPFSDPVRLPPRLHAAFNNAFWYGYQKSPEPSFGYFEPLSEPVRFKQGLAPYQQKEFFYGAPIPVFFDRWNYPWSEPVRQKPGLHASQQDWQEHKPILPPPVFYGSWGYPWSEPVRFKPGLRAWYHPYEFRAPAIYQFTYTARLYAVETDLDRFTGTLYKWWAPLKCYVSIAIRQQIPFARTGIVQTGPVTGANTAIVETKPGSGIFVSIVTTFVPPNALPPAGYAYLQGADGAYLLGADGNYLIGPV